MLSVSFVNTKSEKAQRADAGLTAERNQTFGDKDAYVEVRKTMIADGIIADNKKMMEKM